MYSNDIALPNYPEWYKIERETEKTIKKLTSLRELSFYLRHTEEFIRRLAIIRINELKLKDAIDVLKEILDDRLENHNNKELAAWTIKSISLKWNIDLFISHKLLNNYTGNERSIEINKVTFSDSVPVKFEFSSSLINSELNLETENFRQSEDVNFDMPFSVKEWFSEWFSEFTAASKKVFVRIPSLLIKFICVFAVFVAKNLVLKSVLGIYHTLSKGFNTYKSRPKKHKGTDIFDAHYRSTYVEKVNPLVLIKKGIFKLLYIIFSPIRLITRHKKFSIATFVVIYLLLTYTTYGKIITYKYSGLDLADTQNHVYNSSKEILSYALNEVNSIFSIGTTNNTIDNTIEDNGSSNISQTDETKPDTQIVYRVTAKTGLNIRKAPDATSAKVLSKMLAYNCTVIYLDKYKKIRPENYGITFRHPMEKLGGHIQNGLKKRGVTIMKVNDISNQRAAFVAELLINLKEVCNKLKETSSEIEKGSGKFYEEFFKENISSIKEDIDNYKLNIEKIKKLRSELTEEINSWYSFSKDTNEIRKLTFPLKFQIRKRKLKDAIKRVNESIISITIENRFIKEHLTVWEHRLEIESIEKIKEGSGYNSYERLTKIKESLFEELKYILPTIPEICPIELDLEKIDSLIDVLKKAEHAA